MNRAGETSFDELLAFLLGQTTAQEDARLLSRARQLRAEYWQNRIQVHIINNVRNGNCREDCGYCAQRRTATEDLPDYGLKSDEEILKEAEAAHAAGAYRYCMVMSGRGPGRNTVERVSRVIGKIKERYPLEICLSAGILTDGQLALELKNAGLDRYNHNLNTSKRNYENIASTHSYSDREATLQTMQGAGVSLCSGVIVGLGEEPDELIALAARLAGLGAVSVPVNFFIPVPGHGLKEEPRLTADYCLRVLAMFRMVLGPAEVRLAAGRELYLDRELEEAMQLANSLFVSGYLNVKGSSPDATVQRLSRAGFAIETVEGHLELDETGEIAPQPDGLRMKTLQELRPFH
ncbi:MAG: biotin synthase BioB [Spirochaetales bacterium]|nr:biotin synthase BioB [Spirochaetales bacterium]